jgi:Cellulose biosynthesis protein BcsS
MSPILSRTRGAFLVGCLLLASTAGAQELIMGWEGDSLGGNAFVMPVFSVPKQGKDSLVFRGSAGYLYYTIQGATETRVHSPGGSFGVAWRTHTRRATFTLGPGVEIRRKESIPDIGSSTTVTEKGLTLGGDVFFLPDPLTSVYVNASYGRANRYTWSRAGFKRQLNNKHFDKPTSWSIGLEVTGQGNYEVTSYQVGIVGGPSFPQKKMSLEVRAGISQRKSPGGPTDHLFYAGIGFYRNFTE